MAIVASFLVLPHIIYLGEASVFLYIVPVVFLKIFQEHNNCIDITILTELANELN